MGALFCGHSVYWTGDYCLVVVKPATKQ